MQRVKKTCVFGVVPLLIFVLASCATNPANESGSQTGNTTAQQEEEQPRPTSGLLRFDLPDIERPGVPPESIEQVSGEFFPVVRYTLSMTGPDGETMTTEIDGSIYETSLAGGEWRYIIDGTDVLGNSIARAEGTVSVVGGTAIGKQIDPEPVSSGRNFVLLLSWEPGLIEMPSVEVVLQELRDGTLTERDRSTVAVIEDGLGVYAGTLPPGHYTVGIMVTDGGIERASVLRSVQVIENSVAVISEILEAHEINMPPVSPGTPAVEARSDESLLVSWTDTSDIEDGFEVQRKGPRDSSWIVAATLEPNSSSFLDEGLLASSRYQYRISAFNRFGSNTSVTVDGETDPWESAIRLVAPGTTANLISTSPLFSWTAAEEAVSYDLQLATSDDFSTSTGTTSGISETSIRSPRMLQDRTTYYWRVRGVNEDGIPGTWSETSRFTVSLDVAIHLTTDGSAGGSENTNRTLQVLQGEVIRATAELPSESTDDMIFTWLLNDEPVGDQNDSVEISRHLKPGVYRLSCIVRIDESVVVGSAGFSVASELAIDGLDPQPGNSLWYVDRMSISWNPVPTATAYHIQVARVSGGVFTTLEETDDLTTPEFRIGSALVENTTYAYRIRALDSAETWSSWTPYFTFELKEVIPPTLIFPPKFSRVLDPRPIFRWEPVPGIDSYQIRINRIGGTDEALIAIEGTELRFERPLSVGLWSLDVRSRTSSGEYSDWTSTTFDIASIPTPRPTAPEEGSKTAMSTLLFTWDELPGVPKYEVRLSYVGNTATGLEAYPPDNEAGYEAIGTSDASTIYEVDSPRFAPPESLRPGIIEWQVRGKAASGSVGYFSPKRTVELIPPAAAPELMKPQGGSVSSNRRPEFEWTHEDNADRYEVQIIPAGESFDEAESRIVSATSFRPSRKLSPGAYTWRVRAIPSNGTLSEYSSPSDFEIVSSAVLLIDIPGGSFSMGSSDGDADERPVRTLEVDGFAMSAFEVTQGLYERIMGENPSENTSDPQAPVENVSWLDAVRFCNALSEAEGRENSYEIDGNRVTLDVSKDGYRLPTEIEWEYAARGGTLEVPTVYAGDDTAALVGWHELNSDGSVHPVGTLKANEIGLYDMTGNVWEWTTDTYTSYGDAVPGTGSIGGDYKVVRGGSWDSSEKSIRIANRSIKLITDRDPRTGFRVVTGMQ